MRLTFQPRVTCPAGQPIHGGVEGTACQCTIEGEPITAAKDPSSLQAFCMGAYDLCPTWRFEKDRLAAGRAEVGDQDAAEQRKIDRLVEIQRPEEVPVTYYTPHEE